MEAINNQVIIQLTPYKCVLKQYETTTNVALTEHNNSFVVQTVPV